jgi:hypothetical protein
MRRDEIVDRLAQDRLVERMVLGITHSRTLNADLKDLVQIVYLALLEYPEDKIVDLWESSAINFLVARIIMNQYRSSHSPFRDQVTRFRSLSEDLREFQAEIKETR